MTAALAQPAERPITLLNVDDQEVVRSGYAAMLGTYPDLQVVGTAADGAEVVELATQLKPDVVLMDIRMPVKDGIQATRDIAANPLLARTHVLVLTTFDLDEYAYDALAAGGSGFMLKDSEPDDLAAAIRVVASGETLIQPRVLTRLVEAFVAARPRMGGPAPGSQAAEALRALTDREREILVAVARGLSNDQIAAELFISPATVKTHLARIMAKADAHDRAQLVIFAYESGLVTR